MGYSQSMHVLDGIHDLYKNSACCPLAKPDFFGHEFEKLPLLCIFGDEENILIGFDNFVELDDIGMPEYSHDFDFPVDSFLIIFVFNSFFVNDFDSNFFLCWDMYCFFNFAESALA